MSHYDYIESQSLYRVPFHALIMAAMRKADTPNLEQLKAAWPETWSELEARYHAPGGYLPTEVNVNSEE